MMRRSKTFWLVVSVLPMLAGAVYAGVKYWPAPAPQQQSGHLPPLDEPLEVSARSVLAIYCATCHTSGRSGADFDDPTLTASAMRRDRKTWELAVRKLKNGTMPPRGFPQPADEDRADLVRWIEQEVLKNGADADGAIMARRLLRSEYRRAVADLFGTAIECEFELPGDDRGWDRMSSMPALAEPMREAYRTAAANILEEAMLEELASIDMLGCGPDEMESPEGIVAARATYLFICDAKDKTEAEHARGILAAFAHKAYRRPIKTAEVDELAAIFDNAVKEGASFEQAMRVALLEVLTSPHFLFRIETRPGQAPADAPNAEAHPLASRLSFFLWSSTPDEELLRGADKGFTSENLEAQVRRLLKDPRSQALAVDFAGHWLSLHKLDGPRDLDKPLSKAMRQESEQFVAHILREDRSVLEFLDADYTFVNERLAKHYGIPDVEGETMRRVRLPGVERGGLLTHASILKITSPAGETSPVLRGKWVMENILGAAPVRPPVAVIEALKDSPKKFDAGTPREMLAQHRTNASCAECHAKMDAIGLALENFDGLGAWRTKAYEAPIDAVGDLPDGEVLNGPKDVRDYLRRQPKLFVKALSEKLLAYALGRKLTDRDRAALSSIPDRVAADDYRFSRVLIEVTLSEPFQSGWRGVD